MAITLQELAERLDASLLGDADPTKVIVGCAPIGRAEPDEITFLANQKYVRHLESTRAAAVLIGPNIPCPDHVVRLICDDPYFAFRNALVALAGFRLHPVPHDGCPHTCTGGAAGESFTASAQSSIHPTAVIGAGVVIHPFVSVGADAVVGPRTVLYPGTTIGEHVKIGADCILYPNVTVYDRCKLGDRVTLHASTVIGQDGFGYATNKGVHHKIPQTGVVIIEDDVEMGAGCAIERAAMGETRIGRGTKFADLISIGHGTTIGAGCLFVSLVGVSGSVDVGKYVVLGGQSGTSGHIKIGDGVHAAGRSAIVNDLEPGKRVGGAPAIDFSRAKRNALVGKDLYELFRRVRQLEQQIAQLKDIDHDE